MGCYYSYVTHNPQAITTEDLFIRYPYKFTKTIYRMPYKKRFTREETRNYIFEEFIRQVLLDIIENNTIFVYNDLQRHEVSINKTEVTGELFEKLYKEGRFKLDYLKSNFVGHIISLQYNKIDKRRKTSRYVFLSGDLKSKRDKASEIW